MKILKFKGKNKDLVLGQIQSQYGSSAAIINTTTEEPTGFFKMFKKPTIVVTAAIKEADDEDTSLIKKAEESLKIYQDKLNEQKEQSKSTQEKDSIKDDSFFNLKKSSGNTNSNNNANSNDDSINLLMELKNELGTLTNKINNMKYSESFNPEHTRAYFIKNQLMNNGVRSEVCDILCDRLNITSTTSTEEIIRKLCDEIEELVIDSKDTNLSKVMFFIGSTGVGKTTTIAKLTTKLVLEQKKKVVLFTSDTYRIAAVEQLKTYAEILGVPIEIIYDESELPKYIDKWKDVDHILIDTAGRSHKNDEQVKELKSLIKATRNKEVFLVINANTQAGDVKKIFTTYEDIDPGFELIVTKVDETDEIGNLLNISYYTQRPIMFITTGQNVPADIEQFDKQKYITYLLGSLNK